MFQYLNKKHYETFVFKEEGIKSRILLDNSSNVIFVFPNKILKIGVFNSSNVTIKLNSLIHKIEIYKSNNINIIGENIPLLDIQNSENININLPEHTKIYLVGSGNVRLNNKLIVSNIFSDRLYDSKSST